ncbi:uncharacterized protein [Pseudorca crassidens]|uniref:uncharacterized protein n=1 Tax=Pseudorca crassidens TaxID=82174 RepID=UPI00352C7FE4
MFPRHLIVEHSSELRDTSQQLEKSRGPLDTQESHSTFWKTLLDTQKMEVGWSKSTETHSRAICGIADSVPETANSGKEGLKCLQLTFQRGAVSPPAAPSGSIREQQREEGCRVRCDPTPLQGSPLVAKILACGTRCRDSDAPWLTFRGRIETAWAPERPLLITSGSSSATQPGSPRITPEKECTARSLAPRSRRLNCCFVRAGVLHCNRNAIATFRSRVAEEAAHPQAFPAQEKDAFHFVPVSARLHPPPASVHPSASHSPLYFLCTLGSLPARWLVVEMGPPYLRHCHRQGEDLPVPVSLQERRSRPLPRGI